MCNKTKCKVKKHFCRYCLQFFSSEREHKEAFLKINGKQTVKLRSGSIKFKNHFKQLAVPFKIYADFECNMKRVKSSDKNNNTSYTKKIIFLIVLIIKLFVLIINLANKLFFLEVKMRFINLLMQSLKSIIIT